jgi:hypothetical protein
VKVEVEFPGELGASGPTAIELGRISLGGLIVRVVFDPKGFVRLLVPAEAVEDGYVVFSKPPRGVLGLAPLKVVKRGYFRDPKTGTTLRIEVCTADDRVNWLGAVQQLSDGSEWHWVRLTEEEAMAHKEQPPKDGHLKWMPVARPISGTVMFHDRVLYRWQDGKYHPVVQTEVDGWAS